MDNSWESVLTPAEWETLLAIQQALVPKLTATERKELRALYEKDVENPVSQEVFDNFCDETPELEEARKQCATVFSRWLREDQRKLFKGLLAFLGSSWAFPLTGKLTPFKDLPHDQQRGVLNSWMNSNFKIYSGIYRSFCFLSRSVFIKSSQSANAAMSYPAMVPGHDDEVRFKSKTFYKFQSESPPIATAEEWRLDADFVVIGSGCGAGVVASHICQTYPNAKTLVIEKGYFVPQEDLPLPETVWQDRMFEQGGSLTTDDNSMVIFAGSTLGGGSTVNWSASLQPEHAIRREWADAMGLKNLNGKKFQESLDRVCGRMGVGTSQIKHNFRNQVLMEGCRRLGYHVKVVPQNTAGAEHNCGHCSAGCRFGEKQGGTVTWLVDAANAGCKFLTGAEVTRIVMDGERAVGIEALHRPEGSWNSPPRKVTVTVHRSVFLSAGTLNSPAVLLRSGFTNRNIGRHLRMHPAVPVYGIYAAEQRPWEGACLTSVSNEFFRGTEGAKLECSYMAPCLLLPAFRADDGRDWKRNVLRFKHMGLFFSMARDTGEGQVYVDPACGRIRVKYTTNEVDKQHLLESIIGLVRVIYTYGGLTEIRNPFAAQPHYIIGKDDEEADGFSDRFVKWEEELRRQGQVLNNYIFASAHQMSSCRMGVSPDTSVCDPRGKVWGTSNLWVADASVMPSASGVNPMVTTMGLADLIVRGVTEADRKKQANEGVKV